MNGSIQSEEHGYEADDDDRPPGEEVPDRTGP
jgi:hypothetical protein